MRLQLIAMVLAFLSGGAAVTNSQIANTPEIKSKIAAMGPNLSPDLIANTVALYMPLHMKDDGAGVAVTADLSYGPDDRHVLDVYVPKDGGNDLDVVVFVHGGGFVAGDKAQDVNVGRWFARNNTIVVIPNYRLAPQAKWPAGAKDVALVLEWIAGNIGRFGGDPGKVVLAGTSAGAAHVADYVFREDLQIADDGVLGAILISPPSIDLSLLGPVLPLVAPYYGDAPDPDEKSAIRALEGRNLPLMIVYAELDPPFIHDQVHRLIDGLKQRDGRLPHVTGATGHNHISITAHIGTADDTLAPHLLGFIRSLARDEG